MAAGVRFTKPEREFILRATATCTPKEERLREAIIEKFDRAELTKGKGVRPGIGWKAALAAVRGVYPGVWAPPNPSVVWIVKMNNRIRDLGLTEDDFRHVGRAAQPKRLTFEQAVWKAGELLGTRHPGEAEAVPIEMEDI